METIKQTGDYFIQAIPDFHNDRDTFNKDGYLGLYWKAIVYIDFTKTNYIDKTTNCVTSDCEFNTPEEAIEYMENNLEKIKDDLTICHTDNLDKYVSDIKTFRKSLEKKDSNCCTSILSVEDYIDGNFYTDDGDCTAYVTYNGKVFTYMCFDGYDLTDTEAYDGLKDNDLTMLEIAAKALGCKPDDIKEVLFADYIECK